LNVFGSWFDFLVRLLTVSTFFFASVTLNNVNSRFWHFVQYRTMIISLIQGSTGGPSKIPSGPQGVP